MLAFYQMMSIHMMSAFGGNHYDTHLFAENPVEQTAMNFVPVVPVIEGLGKDISDLFTADDPKERFLPDETLKTVPILGPIYRGISDTLDE